MLNSDMNIDRQCNALFKNAAGLAYERKVLSARRSLLKLTDKMNDQLQVIAATVNEPICEIPTDEPPCHDKSLQADLKSLLERIYPDVSDQSCSHELQDDSIDSTTSTLDRIVSRRIELCELSSQAVKSNIRSANWGDLVSEIEELETRALTLIILPPSNELGVEADWPHQLRLLLHRLEEQAIACLEQAHRLINAPEKPILSRENANLRRQSSGGEIAPTHMKASYDATKPFPTLAEARAMLDAKTHQLHPLLSDYALRKQTLDVKRIIGCACNQITQQAAGHTLDRLQYLLAFMTGETVQASVGGTTRRVRLSDLLPTTDERLGKAYAWQCFFTVVLSQAEHQFIHNLDVAVTFAAILSGILGREQAKVSEFMARVFLACPLLATCHDATATTSVSSDGIRDNSLARWRGLSRLLAALTIARPPPVLRCPRPNHLKPSLLWRLMAGLVNSTFVPGATAEVLHGLLEVGGYVLHCCYGRQMERLLKTIVSKIQRNSELSASIPEISLLSTIEMAQKTGRYVGKKGFLDESFWKKD